MIGDSVEESKSIDPPQRNTERTENRDAARTESERCARRRGFFSYLLYEKEVKRNAPLLSNCQTIMKNEARPYR
jgi:hypothetical protein